MSLPTGDTVRAAWVLQVIRTLVATADPGLVYELEKGAWTHSRFTQQSVVRPLLEGLI